MHNRVKFPPKIKFLITLTENAQGRVQIGKISNLLQGKLASDQTSD